MQNQAEVIKQQIDLADYVRSCGIKLEKHGSKDLKGLCPFHNDKTPSLIISPHKGLFNCPVCKNGGSVIDFAAKIKNISIKDAIKELSEKTYHGPQGNAPGNQPSAHKTSLSMERKAELLERAISFYEKSFANVADGRKYMEGRGVTDAGGYRVTLPLWTLREYQHC